MAVSTVKKSGMISGCENIDVYGTCIAFLALFREQQYKAFSVIRRRVLFVWIGGGKNCLWCLRLCQAKLVRLQTALGARFRVWRLSNLLGDRGASYRMPPMRQGEARETGVAGEQSVLQQTVRVVCGAALPGHDHQRRCSRNAPGLEDHQGVRQGVHARDEATAYAMRSICVSRFSPACLSRSEIT